MPRSNSRTAKEQEPDRVVIEFRDVGSDGRFPARVRRVLSLAKSIGLMQGRLTGWYPPASAGPQIVGEAERGSNVDL